MLALKGFVIFASKIACQFLQPLNVLTIAQQVFLALVYFYFNGLILNSFTFQVI